MADLASEASEQAVNANEQDLADALDMSAPETCLGLTFFNVQKNRKIYDLNLSSSFAKILSLWWGRGAVPTCADDAPPAPMRKKIWRKTELRC